MGPLDLAGALPATKGEAEEEAMAESAEVEADATDAMDRTDPGEHGADDTTI